MGVNYKPSPPAPLLKREGSYILVLLLLIGVLNNTLLAEVEVLYGNKKKTVNQDSGWLLSPADGKKKTKNAKEIITLEDKAKKKTKELEQEADLVLIDKSSKQSKKVYFNQKIVEPPVVLENKPKKKIYKKPVVITKKKTNNLQGIFPLQGMERHNNIFVKSLKYSQVQEAIQELNQQPKSKIQKTYNNYLKVKSILRKTARKQGIAPEFFAIAFVESEFNNNLQGTLDSNHGIWQLNPDIVNYSLNTEVSSQALNSINSSTAIFTKYIKHLTDKYNNSWEWVVMAYVVGENYTSIVYDNYGHEGYWHNNHIDEEVKEYTAEVIAYSFLLK